MNRRTLVTILILLSCLVPGGANVVFAQSSGTQEVDQLQDEIAAHESRINQINSRIDEYREQINYYANQSASLTTDIALIENQMAFAELDIEATQAAIEAQELKIQVIDTSIDQQEVKIDVQKEILEETIFALHKSDGIGFVEVLFGAGTLSDLFAQIDHLQTVNGDLQDALSASQETRAELTENKKLQEEELDQMIELEDHLVLQMKNLESQINAKALLVESTAASELEYRRLLSELRQEQYAITQRVTSLQKELEGKINSLDELGDATVFGWPLTGIITAIFHDPTYPFRHLFEHGGVDIAVPTGTPVEATAPGYVAWARTGRSYGNYVMLIHANGYASLYAHLNSINVSADQFVSRGDVIGYSGNTGFSTGPHLHFEIRQNGIPVDPFLYLP